MGNIKHVSLLLFICPDVDSVAAEDELVAPERCHFILCQRQYDPVVVGPLHFKAHGNETVRKASVDIDHISHLDLNHGDFASEQGIEHLHLLKEFLILCILGEIRKLLHQFQTCDGFIRKKELTGENNSIVSSQACTYMEVPASLFSVILIQMNIQGSEHGTGDEGLLLNHFDFAFYQFQEFGPLVGTASAD